MIQDPSTTLLRKLTQQDLDRLISMRVLPPGICAQPARRARDSVSATPITATPPAKQAAPMPPVVVPILGQVTRDPYRPAAVASSHRAHRPGAHREQARAAWDAVADEPPFFERVPLRWLALGTFVLVATIAISAIWWPWGFALALWQ